MGRQSRRKATSREAAKTRPKPVLSLAEIQRRMGSGVPSSAGEPRHQDWQQQAWYRERQQAARERAAAREAGAAPRSRWAGLVYGLNDAQSEAWTAMLTATYVEDWPAASAALRRVQATGADDLPRMRIYWEGLEWPYHVDRYRCELVEVLRETFGSAGADAAQPRSGESRSPAAQPRNRAPRNRAPAQ